jgi:branched-chain amino acid transport system substrate-binding protein
MKSCNKVLCAVFIIILSISCYSQSSVDEEINSQFRFATNLYNSNNLDQALTIFSNIITEYDYNSKTTASQFFIVKIYLEKDSYTKARETLNSFIEFYPESIFIDEIRMMIIKLNIEELNYYDAFKETVILIESTRSKDYRKEAVLLGEKIAFNYLNSIQLQRLSGLFTSPKAKPFILLQLGRIYLRESEQFNAKSVFAEIIKDYNESDEYNEAKRLYDSPYNLVEGSSNLNLIGVMLPLQTNSVGDYTSVPVAEILEGIKLAVSEFNRNRENKIGLVVRDTKKDVEEIEEIKYEFERSSSIKVILGPIYSNEVRVTLQEFEDTDIPIISPTATDDDLSGLSENFFQANPSFSKRGRIIAQYVYFVENKRKISILNAIEGYSPLLAATFAEEFERLGGSILQRESYKSKSHSFAEQISRIAVDSLILDGLYVPLADNIDAPSILSHLVQFNLKIPIYGNQDWFTAKGFETSTEISNQLIFSSDYFLDFNDDDYQSFNNLFSSIMGKDANRNVLYGYDTAKYLLTVMRNIDNTRINIRNKMISGLTSTGFHNNIAFDENRVNRFLNIVRYQDGVFELVEKFRAGN